MVSHAGSRPSLPADLLLRLFREQVSVVFDRSFESCREVDFWLPAEVRFRLVDVQAAPSWIVFRQFSMFDF